METVEAANSKQLNALLTEVTETAFFRLINVNMDGKCQYWGGPETEEPSCDGGKNDETFAAFAEPSAPPLCSLGTDAPAPSGGSSDPFGGSPFGGSSSSSSFSSPFGMSAAPPSSDPVDATITPEENRALLGLTPEDCSDEELPTFWLDLCSAIPTNASDYVNLQRNPESYTGYNGTKIWDAIYQENCLQRTAGHEEGICLEERVLYRLLSGMHAATNIHIARFYYMPSRRKGTTDWTPNLQYFRRQVDGHPERLKNLHFAFVVLLRALRRASPFLSSYDYSFEGGASRVALQAAAGDEGLPALTSGQLVQRLLDSAILKSCSSVFEAFDEGLLFREAQAQPWWSLKKQFKGVFHNVSKVLDCVSCQKCRLHAKVTMLGYGTALKMLLLPPELFATAFTRDEIVALFNTLAKFSSSIVHVRELTEMLYNDYYASQATELDTARASNAAHDEANRIRELSPSPSLPPAVAAPSPSSSSSSSSTSPPLAPPDATLLDATLAALAAASRQGLLTAEEEARAVALALAGDARLLLVAKHFGKGSPAFSGHVRSALAAATAAPPPTAAAAAAAAAPTAAVAATSISPDAIVVGSGVAGMTAALRLLDRGAKVVLVDKEGKVGGNSAKASSGINGCCPAHSRSEANRHDTIEAFANDTARSAKREPDGLIGLLARKSAEMLDWLRERTSIDLSRVAQLGGHSHARTHRPNNGMIGAELTFVLHRELKAYAKSGALSIRTGCRMTGFLLDDDDGSERAAEGGSRSGAGSDRRGSEGVGVRGIRYVVEKTGEVVELAAPQTVLATGGYANDHTNTSLLAKHRPDLLTYPTTNGVWATGDGMKLAMAIGADSIDMDKVQVHPTGFVDPAEVGAPTKVLCGEMMRGVGGVLLRPNGARFVDELKPRDKVVDAQLGTGEREFAIVLNEPMALEAGKHVELYTRKGLLVKVAGADGLARWMASDVGVLGAQPPHASREGEAAFEQHVANLSRALSATMDAYNRAADANGEAPEEEGDADPYGKRVFRHTPIRSDPTATLYVGRIVPVLHYTMGGIRMDEHGRVLRADGSIITGLSAAGEVTGGVHGNNRLGGNSLLECAVFGSIVGLRLPIASKQAATAAAAAIAGATDDATPAVGAPTGATERGDALRAVGVSELAAHASEESCWVALHGKVYDFTAFLEDHPAGPDSILKLGGKDGTEEFDTVHNANMLADFESDLIGRYAPEIP